MVVKDMTIASRALSGLSLSDKRELLARLLKEKAGRSATVFPLSHGQRGLWFLHQLDPNSSAYNVCYPSRIRSPLDLPALRRAVQKLVLHHPSLRTTFEERDGVLFQRVHEKSSLPFELIDASCWSEEMLREKLEEVAHRPFDLERGPLVRMHIFRRAADDHIVVLCVHHIVGDFWSLVLVIEQLQALYPAECAGTPLALQPPAQQYSDFVRWQAELLAGPEGQRLAEEWERQLCRAPVVLDLPLDRPRPPVFSRGGSGPLAARAGTGAPAQGAGCERRHHALRALAGRVPGAARALHRPGRFPGRLPVRRPQPTRIRGGHRLLRQHAAPAPTCPATPPSACCCGESVPRCCTRWIIRTIRSPS